MTARRARARGTAYSKILQQIEELEVERLLAREGSHHAGAQATTGGSGT